MNRTRGLRPRSPTSNEGVMIVTLSNFFLFRQTADYLKRETIMVIVPLLNYPGQKPEEPEEEVGSSFKLFFILIHIFTMHTGTGAV